MSRVQALLSAIISAIAIAIFLYIHGTDEASIKLPFQQYLQLDANQNPLVSSPFTPSWISWFHPENQQPDIEPKQKGGEITKDWNILYHLGGNGPWIQKIDGVVESHTGPPLGCKVEQVHMIARHSERYPTWRVGLRMMTLLELLKSPNVTLVNDLAFVKDWQYFSSDPQANFEQLTTTGPYAGTLGAFTTDVRLRTRYAHLLPHRLSLGGGKSRFWASDSERVIDTARYFAAGFFGLSWKNTADLHVIPETAERGGDTLTPGDTCTAYLTDLEHGHDQGYEKFTDFTHTYLPAIAARLESYISLRGVDLPFRFADDEIYAMQEMCGFETTVRGKSPWCDVFTQDEWRAFEYARDIIHFYRAGPGTKYSAAMGGLWLNATNRLLLEGPQAGPLFFSFVRDGDIAPILSALDIFHDDEPLPVTYIATDRNWRTSQVTPMGGRIIFERLSCRSIYDGNAHLPFVRININDGIVAIPGCEQGPGHSCPLDGFIKRQQQHQEKAGEFRTVCGLKDDVSNRITFLHQ